MKNNGMTFQWTDLRMGSVIDYNAMTLCVVSLPIHCTDDADGSCDDYLFRVVEIATGQFSDACVMASADFTLISL